MEQHQGRLELTWANKEKRLLSNKDGGYTWVERSDYRVAEVRLLHEISYVGDISEHRTDDNLLIRGDSLHALRSLTSLSEYAEKYLGKVRLAYLDPPFNTEQAFVHYEDAVEHSVWLTLLKDRLELIRRLLSPDGSVWVHCDDGEQAYLKILMDEIMGRDNFIATVVWQKVDSPNENNASVTPDHDFIHGYSKNVGGSRLKPMSDESIIEAYPNKDNCGHRYRDRLLKKNGKNSLRADRPSMYFPIVDPEGGEVYPVHDDGREARWAMGRASVDRLLADNRIIWKQRNNNGDSGQRWIPYTREWAPQNPTRPWPTIWTDVDTTRQSKAHLRSMFPGVTVFETPKPERLVQRIIEIASDPGDVVLDCFLGSGTTASVAHKLDRQWIGIEPETASVEDFTLPRLRMVVNGQDPGGITLDVGWSGGGGFRVLDVATSMFAVIGERVVLSDWATNGQLQESVAAQVNAAYAPDAPFAGRRGRSRLAVVDGLVNSDVVRLLIQSLGEGEVLHVCGTALDPDVHTTLQTDRPGSVAQKIPESILQGYRREFSRRRRWERTNG